MNEPRKIVTPRGNLYVWWPDGYTPDGNTVAYVHGYYNDVPGNIRDYKLIEQFQKSGVKAVFVIPEAPQKSSEPVYFPSLTEMLIFVQNEGIRVGPPVLAIGHSGAYRTLVKWLGDTGLKTIVLLDALYANVSNFANWAKIPGHKLICVTATSTPIANSEKLKGVPNVTILRANSTHMGLVNGTKNYIAQYVRQFASGATATALLLVAAAIAFVVLRG